MVQRLQPPAKCLSTALDTLEHACRPEGAPWCRLLQEGRSLLETASMSGKTPSVKAAAAEALAVLAFVGSEHPSDSLEVAQHLQSLWKGNAHPLPLQPQEE